MIERLTISGYRGFERVELRDLGRLNLLVGRNGAGKTSLLEAVRLVATGLSNPTEIPGVLWAAAQRRGEVVADHARLRHVVHRGRLDDADISLETDRGSIRLRLVQDHGPKLKLLREPVKPGDDVGERPRWHLVDVDALDRPRDQELRDAEGWAVHPIVGPEMASAETLAEMFGRIVLTPEEDRLTAALKAIEPRLLRLAATGERPHLVARLEGIAERLPLGNLGGGIRRMAQLWLSFALAGGRPLLVDEIDAGLHHSVMVDMWRRVRHLAAEHDLQVFATTHSWDCVAALGSMCIDDDVPAGEVSLQRVEPGARRAVAYSAERIALAAERGIEVR